MFRITIWSWIFILSGPYSRINNTGTRSVHAQVQQQGQGQPSTPSSLRPPYCDCTNIANPTSDVGQSSFAESGYCTNTGETLTDLCDVANKLYSSQSMGLRPCDPGTNGTPMDETQTDDTSPDTSDSSDESSDPSRTKRQVAVNQVTQACLTNGSSVSVDMAALTQIIANNTELGLRCLSRCPCDIHCPVTGDTETGYPSSSGRTKSPGVNSQAETYTLPPGDALGGSYDPDQSGVDGNPDPGQPDSGFGNNGGGQFGGQNNGQTGNLDSGANGNAFPMNSNNGNQNSFNPSSNNNGYQASPNNNGNQNSLNPSSNSYGSQTRPNNNGNQNSFNPSSSSNGYQTSPSINGNQNSFNPNGGNNGYQPSPNNNGNQNYLNPYSNNNSPQSSQNYNGNGQTSNMSPSQGNAGSQSGYQNSGNQGLPVWDIKGNNWNVGQGASQQNNLYGNSGNTGNYDGGRYGANSYQNSNNDQYSQQMYATHGQNSYWTSDGQRTGSHGFGRFQVYFH